MSNILGLHFGHDAGACVVRDGRIAACIVRERHNRVKHAISLDISTIQAALDAAGLSFEQIDYCAITSTQCIELIIQGSSDFTITFDPHPRHTAPCTLSKLLRASRVDPRSRLVESLMGILYDPKKRNSYLHHHYGHSFPEYRGREPGDFRRFGWIDSYVSSTLWPGATLAEIAAKDFSSLLQDDSTRHGFHFPVTVSVGGRSVAGYFIAHHMAHAASSYYQSGFDAAAILTHDGFGNGLEYLSGMFYWAEREKIFPLTPHHLTLGLLYEMTGVRLGLGMTGRRES